MLLGQRRRNERRRHCPSIRVTPSDTTVDTFRREMQTYQQPWKEQIQEDKNGRREKSIFALPPVSFSSSLGKNIQCEKERTPQPPLVHRNSYKVARDSLQNIPKKISTHGCKCVCSKCRHGIRPREIIPFEKKRHIVQFGIGVGETIPEVELRRMPRSFSKATVCPYRLGI